LIGLRACFPERRPHQGRHADRLSPGCWRPNSVFEPSDRGQGAATMRCIQYPASEFASSHGCARNCNRRATSKPGMDQAACWPAPDVLAIDQLMLRAPLRPWNPATRDSKHNQDHAQACAPLPNASPFYIRGPERAIPFDRACPSCSVSNAPITEENQAPPHIDAYRPPPAVPGKVPGRYADPSRATLLPGPRFYELPFAGDDGRQRLQLPRGQTACTEEPRHQDSHTQEIVWVAPKAAGGRLRGHVEGRGVRRRGQLNSIPCQ